MNKRTADHNNNNNNNNNKQASNKQASNKRCKRDEGVVEQQQQQSKSTPKGVTAFDLAFLAADGRTLADGKSVKIGEVTYYTYYSDARETHDEQSLCADDILRVLAKRGAQRSEATHAAIVDFRENGGNDFRWTDLASSEDVPADVREAAEAELDSVARCTLFVEDDEGTDYIYGVEEAREAFESALREFNSTEEEKKEEEKNAVARVYYAGGKPSKIVKPRNGTDFSLEEMQEHVGQKDIEFHFTDSVFVACDEMGRVKRLPLNTSVEHLELGIDFYGDILVAPQTMMK